MALPEDSGRRKTSHVYLRRKVEKRWELQYHRSSSFWRPILGHWG